MNWRHYLVLFVLGLAVPFAVSRYQSLPGYMDADYYFGGGIQLATGKGFTEPYIWNYLADPQRLPTPSHTYWMPLASIVSAAGMWLASQTTYAAGRFPFILLSACVPLLTATLAFDISKSRRVAMVAGLLAIFSLYYAPFMPVPDNYAIYMLLGGAFLYLAPRTSKWILFILGMLAGLMTLARSDGLLWQGLAVLVVLWKSTHTDDETRNSLKEWLHLVIPGGLLVLLGYLIIMGPWHYRSFVLFHSFLTPGGGRLLWLQNYRETFIYPAERLTLASFLQAGWGLAWQNRVNALYSNLNTALFAQGGIFLFPFLLIGVWQLRHDLRTKIVLAGWSIMLFFMTIIFPFAGARGSFHHAGAAFQPFFWAAMPIGLNVVLSWLQRSGRFTDRYAPYVFHGMLVFFAIILTGYLVYMRVMSTGWATDDVIYPSVEAKLEESGISPMDVVIVPNPPGYYVRTGRSAVRLPLGSEATVMEVAKRYQAWYLIVEKSDSLGDLQNLYDDPLDHAGFIYLGEVDGAHLYHIQPPR